METKAHCVAEEEEEEEEPRRLREGVRFDEKLGNEILSAKIFSSPSPPRWS